MAARFSGMAKYFFHTDDGRSILDDEGMELATALAAKLEAARLFGELVRDQPEEFWAAGALKVIVTDESGLILFILDLSGVEAPALRAVG
jgi:hypothetical protein